MERRSGAGPASRRVGRFYRVLALAAGAVVLVVQLPPLWFQRYVDVDEAYASALAERLQEGFRLYEGAVSQRGPLMYYLYELLAALSRWDDVRALRVAALLFALAHVALVWTVGRRLFGQGIAAVASLVCAYTITLGLEPYDGMALNGEQLQVPFILGSVLLGGLAMRSARRSRERVVRLAAAGLLCGCAIAIKQSVAILPLPLVVWIALDAARGRRWAAAAVDASVYLVAVALPASVLLAHAALDGTLSSLWYFCVTYNLTAHRLPGARFSYWADPLYGHLRGHTAYFLLAAVALTSVGLRWGRRVALALRTRRPAALASGFTAEDYVGLSALATLAMAASLPQHFGHYYVVPAPLLALTVACVARRALRPLRIDRALRTVLASAVALFVAYGVLFAYRTAQLGGLLTHDALVLTTAAYIERTTTKDDRIFVWGFSPWLYGYAHRRPAGRYVFETYVTGLVPLFYFDLEHEASRVVPGSMEALLGDLDRERPVLVADAGSLQLARPMNAYPAAAAWLRANYCFEARVGHVDLYRRRDGAACATRYFPCPHPPLTHWGEPLFVPMPPVVDREGTGLLGVGPPDVPKGFAPDERPWACPP